MPNPTDAPSRRAEYAQRTRQAILDAARELYIEKGYFGTKVEDIARRARVAPATVYAVGGGKHGLLRTLIESGTTAEEIAAVLTRIEESTDPLDLVRFIVRATRERFEEWNGLMRQVVVAAPQEPTVREVQRIAHASMRNGLALTARRLARLGALRDGVDEARATDLLWLHLCNAAYFIRTDDLGWSLDESEAWLVEVLPPALLKAR
ncbi:TetR/AcrR family transcriptional regulator [Catenuloplanes atrovinosus]|uniref:AcrR family transcriptional regulator n=1 Tax=Catenuloplanes atrovinosus TaxID=137266 RepID=A0AAE3YXB8_9ACTN|nr:TetR/AcrR family transcriptional regulator [Catenuloplanes atrovinosus]MDR7280128.1 AcrR family transcriptional regulator [Catenuloplanes atrovinosus]